MTGRRFRIDRGGALIDVVTDAPDRRPAARKLPSGNPERYPDALARRIVQRNVAALLAP